MWLHLKATQAGSSGPWVRPFWEPQGHKDGVPSFCLHGAYNWVEVRHKIWSQEYCTWPALSSFSKVLGGYLSALSHPSLFREIGKMLLNFTSLVLTHYSSRIIHPGVSAYLVFFLTLLFPSLVATAQCCKLTWYLATRSVCLTHLCKK